MIGLYKYETHMHTLEASACAHSTAAAMADKYKAEGYTGIFVTDHFFNGNTCIPRDLPWEERVELYCKGYEHAKARGDEIGLEFREPRHLANPHVVLEEERNIPRIFHEPHVVNQAMNIPKRRRDQLAVGIGVVPHQHILAEMPPLAQVLQGVGVVRMSPALREIIVDRREVWHEIVRQPLKA